MTNNLTPNDLRDLGYSVCRVRETVQTDTPYFWSLDHHGSYIHSDHNFRTADEAVADIRKALDRQSIPIIYASIGDREDVNVNPTRAQVVLSVLTSPLAKTYHAWLDSSGDAVNEDYVNQLEVALLEALSPEFLADRIREVVNNRNIVRAEEGIYQDVLKIIANRIARQSSL